MRPLGLHPVPKTQRFRKTLDQTSKFVYFQEFRLQIEGVCLHSFANGLLTTQPQHKGEFRCAESLLLSLAPH